jgi:hypothetical protein
VQQQQSVLVTGMQQATQLLCVTLCLTVLHAACCCIALRTAGGICPGMNDIIQALCKRLADYGVHEESVLGIR